MISSLLKKILRFCSFFAIAILGSYCKKEIPLNEPYIPPYSEIENSIRKRYDSYAVFTWDQYKELLIRLLQNKYIVLPLNEMRSTYDPSKVVIGLRHDVDFNAFKALEMARIEKEYGIRSTYFILATADYYGQFIGSGINRSPGIEYLFREIHNTGAEIGIHNDLLAVMINYNIDPYEFNKSELAFYNSLRIKIHGTAAHGSQISKYTVPNYQIFSDFSKSDSVLYMGKKYPLGEHSLSDYGFKYEAYSINYGIYYSDSGGIWNDLNGFSGILKRIDASKPGDRIQILVHPDWWGKIAN